MNELKVGMIEEKTRKLTAVNTVLTEMCFHVLQIAFRN